jgi:hypothetical protein
MSSQSPNNNSDSDDTSPIDPIDEQLVAYLDGELDDVEREDLENQLVADDSLRLRLNELQSGWEMLDSLPPSNVTEDFARTTVEMVAATESRLMQTQSSGRPWNRLGWFAFVAAMATIFGGVGYSIPITLEKQRSLSELELLPLAEHLDAYLVDIDLKLIEQLANDPTWQESMRLAIDAGGITIAPPLDLAQRDPWTRIDTIQKADRPIRVNMSTNWARLQSLPDEKLERVQHRAAQVRETASPSLTMATLEQYSRWWQQLSPRSKDAILNEKPDQKLSMILQQVQRSSRYWVRNYATTLGETDKIPIQQQLTLIARDRIGTARNRYTQFLTQSGSTKNPESTPWWNITPERLLDIMAMRPSRSPSGAIPGDDGAESERKIVGDLFGAFSDSELASIQDLLSRQAIVILFAESDSEYEKRITLSNWCMEIMQQMSPNNGSFESILSRYQFWDSEATDREALDLKQAEVMINELTSRRGFSFGR